MQRPLELAQIRRAQVKILQDSYQNTTSKHGIFHTDDVSSFRPDDGQNLGR